MLPDSHNHLKFDLFFFYLTYFFVPTNLLLQYLICCLDIKSGFSHWREPIPHSKYLFVGVIDILQLVLLESPTNSMRNQLKSSWKKKLWKSGVPAALDSAQKWLVGISCWIFSPKALMPILAPQAPQPILAPQAPQTVIDKHSSDAGTPGRFCAGGAPDSKAAGIDIFESHISELSGKH